MNYSKMEKVYIETLIENDRLKLENELLKSIVLTRENYLEFKKSYNVRVELNKKIEKVKKELQELEERKELLKKEISTNTIIIEKEVKPKKKKNKIKSLMGSKEYKEFRKNILKRDNYCCQECGCKEKLQVHHIKSKSKFPELIMEPDNCITLCIICHSKTDNFFSGR